jgi:chromosome segregation ATPase
MITLLSHRFLLAVLLPGILLAAPGTLTAGGSACDRIRNRISDIRNQISEVDRQIQNLDAVLYTGQKLTPEESARQQREEQRLRERRAELTRTMAGLEQRVRDIDRLAQIVRTETDQFLADLNAFKADKNQFETECDAHNRDADAQRRACAYFNNLPAQQQSKAEADRLNRWGAEVNARRDRINSRIPGLDSRRLELIRREKALLNYLSELTRLQSGY